MSAPNLKIVSIHESNYRDPVAALRLIADEIERGEHGTIGCVGVAVFGDKLEVYGMGEDAEAPSVALVLHAAFMKLSSAVMNHGQEPE